MAASKKTGTGGGTNTHTRAHREMCRHLKDTRAHTDRHMHMHTDTDTDWHTHTHTYRHTNTHMHRHTNTHMDIKMSTEWLDLSHR